MAAVLLDREGKFHIFHDYSVPQHVDFSALAWFNTPPGSLKLPGILTKSKAGLTACRVKQANRKNQTND